MEIEAIILINSSPCVAIAEAIEIKRLLLTFGVTFERMHFTQPKKRISSFLSCFKIVLFYQDSTDSHCRRREKRREGNSNHRPGCSLGHYSGCVALGLRHRQILL